MSKCDIYVELDKPEPQFSTDETVTGNVIVNVNTDVNCRALKIGGCWQTHGRGNRDTFKYQEQVVYEGVLQAGQRQAFPFSIPLSDVPVTYRGKLINLDHYVDVRVDVPWGFDVKQRAEFIVLPGSVGSFSAPVQRPPGTLSSDVKTVIGTVATVILLLTGLVTFIFGIGFIFLGLGLWIGYLTFRKQFAEGRLGKVHYRLKKEMAAPGDYVPIELSFTPKKSGKINQVLATLTGTETAISGSGTNKTTHRHKICDVTFDLQGPEQFQAGQQVNFTGGVHLPEISAYSFNAGNNSVTWAVQLKIDIPMWPDWIQTENLSLVPRTFLYGDATLPGQMEPATQPDARQSIPSLITEHLVAAGMASATTVTGPPPLTPLTKTGEDPLNRDVPETIEAAAVESPSTTGPDQSNAERAVPKDAEAAEPAKKTPPPEKVAISLEETCTILHGSSNDREDQARILEAVKNQEFPVTVEIERISSTYSWKKDSRYNNGKTLVGTLQGTDHQIQIQIPNERNGELSKLNSGDIWTGTGQVIGRDSLFRRIEMLGN